MDYDRQYTRHYLSYRIGLLVIAGLTDGLVADLFRATRLMLH